jgi:hypothetical protein
MKRLCFVLFVLAITSVVFGGVFQGFAQPARKILCSMDCPPNPWCDPSTECYCDDDETLTNCQAWYCGYCDPGD